MKLDETKINNILLFCNSADVEQLLKLCLDEESGVTIDKLRAAGYRRIDQLEQRYYASAEEMVWASAQNDVNKLDDYIKKCQQGIYSDSHLQAAKERVKELAAQFENEEWKSVSVSGSYQAVLSYLQKCIDNIYSEAHLEEARLLAEQLEWIELQHNCDVQSLNGYIGRCDTVYTNLNHKTQAKDLMNKAVDNEILSEWNKVKSSTDVNIKRNLLNEFISKYQSSETDVARDLLSQADHLMSSMADAESARIDWIDAKAGNTILGYVNFNAKHPYSEYREEADEKIESMKSDLLTDMKRFPFKYSREVMYQYISTRALTMEDLVDKTNTLTDRGYSHIKQFPTLQSEQRQLPISMLANPTSENGNTDVYFFGVSGSGKTCVLAGLMSLTGQLGFRFDPKGPGGGGNYAMDLRNYARTSMLPPATDQSMVQVIDAQINDEENKVHKLSLIEMSGEKTAQFAAMNDSNAQLGDLGPGAAGLLSNNNSKLFFFVIDPVNEKDIHLGETSGFSVKQSDVLNCVSSLLLKDKALLKKVIAIHIILTKSDTLGDYLDSNVILEKLRAQGYQAVFDDINQICEQNDINKSTDFSVGLYPFCVGKFMAGDVYTFDETSSLKILRVIQKNSIPKRPIGPWDRLKDFFNN